VVPLTGDDIRDVFVGQALLAGELAARAVKHSDADDLAHLERLHSDLEAAAGRGDHDELEELNFRFHRAVNLLAGSPKLAWLLGVSLSYVPARFHSAIDGWPAATVQDHREVLEAFRHGSARSARSAMTRHIEHAGELLAMHVDSEAAWARFSELGPADLPGHGARAQPERRQSGRSRQARQDRDP